MRKESEFTSAVAPLLQGFLDEKRACGYKYNTESKWLRRLDAYWIANNGSSTELTHESLENWCAKTETEGASSWRNRVDVTRQFCRYAQGLGLSVWVPDMRVHVPKPVIHILSPQEIKEFFVQADTYLPKNRNARNLKIAREYPVIFRLILTTGLRNGEAVSLRREDVHADTGTLTILGAKGDKDRIVYVSDDMMEVLTDYMDWHTVAFSGENLLFPGYAPGTHLSSSGLSAKFHVLWEQTPVAASCAKAPTVHALRHTFVVLRINGWAAKRLDTAALHPYLARQLGHKSPTQTLDDYYHQVHESLNCARRKDRIGSLVIPEVRPR